MRTMNNLYKRIAPRTPIYTRWKEWDEDMKVMRAKRDKKIERAENAIEKAREEYSQWYHTIHLMKQPSISREEERKIEEVNE